MEEELNPTGTVPDADATNVPAAESVVNDSQTVSLKEVVKELTGREYKDDADAARGIQETYKFSTKRMEEPPSVTPISQVDPAFVSKVESLEKQIQEASFYALHPEYNNEDAKALISAMGGNPAKAVENEAFKKAFDAIRANAEIEKSKSVLQTSSRLGQVTDKFSQATEALNAGNQQAANASAVSAVLEAYPELRPTS
jgi:hypothetical protein